MGFYNSDHVVLSSSSDLTDFWNYGQVVLKSSIRTLALPRQQQSDLGLRVTQDEYFH